MQLRFSETVPFCARVLCDSESARTVVRIVASKLDVKEPLRSFSNLQTLELEEYTAWSQLADVCAGVTSLTSLRCAMYSTYKVSTKFPAKKLAAALPLLRTLRLEGELRVKSLSPFTSLTDLELPSAHTITCMPPRLRRFSGKAVPYGLLPGQLAALKTDSAGYLHMLQDLCVVDVADAIPFEVFRQFRYLRRFAAWGITGACITEVLDVWPASMEEFSVRDTLRESRYRLRRPDVKKLQSLTTYAYPCFGGKGEIDARVWDLATDDQYPDPIRMPRLRKVVRAPYAPSDKDHFPDPPELLMHERCIWPNLEEIDLFWSGSVDHRSQLRTLLTVRHVRLMVFRLTDIDFNALQYRYPNLRVLVVQMLDSGRGNRAHDDNPDRFGGQWLTELKHLQCLHMKGLLPGARKDKIMRVVTEELKGSAVCVCQT